jgi:bis(5'-nucleosyl)-tetraphosphatase (symmetrical)
LSTYVVGDIQGCLAPLQCLLEEVAFDPAVDVLWSVGDVVNRGPSCLETLRFLYQMRDALVVVLGNHDLHLLAIAAGVRKPHRGDTLDKILEAPDRETLLGWLIQQPLLHHEHGFTLVHAGIPPQWSVEQAATYASEVEVVLRGPDSLGYFQAMYGNEPPLWSESLTGMTRLRVITNCLTRIRHCNAQGQLDLISKGVTANPEMEGFGPWFDHPQRKAASERIVFGHWASLEGKTDTPNTIGLDTGCVWGRCLTFYQLETGHLTQCHCGDNG